MKLKGQQGPCPSDLDFYTDKKIHFGVFSHGNIFASHLFIKQFKRAAVLLPDNKPLYVLLTFTTC